MTGASGTGPRLHGRREHDGRRGRGVDHLLAPAHRGHRDRRGRHDIQADHRDGGELHGDNRDFKHQRAAARSTCPSWSAGSRWWPPPGLDITALSAVGCPGIGGSRCRPAHGRTRVGIVIGVDAAMPGLTTARWEMHDAGRDIENQASGCAASEPPQTAQERRWGNPWRPSNRRSVVQWLPLF
jgi:hypothetical protein